MTKCGSVAMIGLANVGKSSLVNKIVGQKVSIVSSKPNTTRDRVCGIKNGVDEKGDKYQIIFYDTPGISPAHTELNKIMGKQISNAVAEVDVICYCLDEINDAEIGKIKNYEKKGTPVIVVVNKTDIKSFEKLYPQLNKLNTLAFVKSIICVSAKTGKNIDVLEKEIVKFLPEDETQFKDEEMFTTQNVRFLASEIIRESALNLLNKEIPHGIGVEIVKFIEGRSYEIYADILCESKTHKPIIVGKGGQMLRKIGTMSRIELEKLLGAHVNLMLFVKVESDWRNRANILKELGYNNK